MNLHFKWNDEYLNNTDDKLLNDKDGTIIS
jgi:hypothetical protein